MQRGHAGRSRSIRPASARPDERFTERLEALRTWRKNLAAEIGVGSDVILPRDLMISLAEKGPQHASELSEAMEAAPWRLEHFGDQILEVLRSLQAQG